MSFSSDTQTLNDLNVFGKHGQDSILAIFNQCVTKGGANILEEMFRYPLSQEEAINGRSDTIRYFAENGINFPFSSAYFETIELYLRNTDERSKLSAQVDSASSKLGNILNLNAEISAIQQGIFALTEVLLNLDACLKRLELRPGDPYHAEAAAISALLGPLSLPNLSQGQLRRSPVVLAALDELYRFRYREEILKILRHIYDLDVYISVGKAARAHGFSYAKALPGSRNEIVLESFYHPVLKNPVNNSLKITKDNNVIFLTGANMAGKSTFMKSLSICLYLGHMGFPVAAAKMEFSVLDGIFTTINLPDNLGIGASHFYAEVLRVKKIANELAQGKNLFILFDELFRGTNVKDACEATIAVTGAFAANRKSIFVISTHIIEAADVLKASHDNVHFIYLPTKMENNRPIYTYKIQEGVTDDRHGMVIINNEGIIDLLESGVY